MTSGRPPNILRPVKLTTYLPEDLRAKLDLHLFSTVEGRVPHGAYSKFLIERVRDFLDTGAKQVAAGPLADSETRLAKEGLLTRIAMTDLRTGWSAETVTDFVVEARRLTGRIPR